MPMVAIIITKNIGLVIKVLISYNAVIWYVIASILGANINPISNAGRENLYCLHTNPNTEQNTSIAKSSQPPVYCIQTHTIIATVVLGLSKRFKNDFYEKKSEKLVFL